MAPWQALPLVVTSILMDEAPDITFAMPAYNEEEALPATIDACFEAIDSQALRAEVVVCDDGSSDGTAALLARMAEQDPRLRFCSRKRNGGYGAALAGAVNLARGKLIATLDSDGQFDPKDALPMLAKIEEGYDAILGYRKHKVDKPLRVFLDRCLRLLVRILFGLRFRDTNCALRLVPRSAFCDIVLEARGFANPTEVAATLHAVGLQIGERTVTTKARHAGASAT